MKPNTRRTPVHILLNGGLLSQLEDWRRRQSEIPSRPKAVEELLAQALADASAGEHSHAGI
jgi:hypothetical protein